jgi:ornithine cyclodeaminase
VSGADGLWVDTASLRSALPVGQCVAALRSALLDEAPSPIPRDRRDSGDRQLLLMPAFGTELAGVKIVSIVRTNPGRGVPAIQGVYVLFDGVTMTPLRVLDAAELTLTRTAAVSLLAITELLATVPSRPAPRVVTVFGTGPQALRHLEVIASWGDGSWGDAELRCVARSETGRDAVRRLADRLDRPIQLADPTAVADSDVVVCATTSAVPLFDSRLLPDRAVVVAIGSHDPDRRELDTALLGRGFVVVESSRAARTEAGDVIMSETELGRGVVDASLAELVRGDLPELPAGPRVFKSVGEAWQDLAVAGVVHRALVTPA